MTVFYHIDDNIITTLESHQQLSLWGQTVSHWRNISALSSHSRLQRSSPSAAAVTGRVGSELREALTAGLPSAGLDRLRVEVGLGLRAVDAVNAGGAAGGLVDAGAAVLGATAGGGAQHGESALTAVSARGLALGQSTVGVARGAAGAEAGDGWEDWQIRGTTETGEGTEGRVGSLHRLGVRVG